MLKSYACAILFKTFRGCRILKDSFIPTQALNEFWKRSVQSYSALFPYITPYLTLIIALSRNVRWRDWQMSDLSYLFTESCVCCLWCVVGFLFVGVFSVLVCFFKQCAAIRCREDWRKVSCGRDRKWWGWWRFLVVTYVDPSEWWCWN